MELGEEKRPQKEGILTRVCPYCEGSGLEKAVLDTPITLVEGSVRWWSQERGHGFLEDEDGNEYFVHYKDLDFNETGKKNLIQGEMVSFEYRETARGLKAVRVHRRRLP